jgi:hypothetical protein
MYGLKPVPFKLTHYLTVATGCYGKFKIPISLLQTGCSGMNCPL